MKVFLFQAILFCCVAANLNANYKTDSLYQLSKNQEGTKKLETLYSIVSDENNDETLVNDIEELYSAALGESNHLYLAGADRHMAEYYFLIRLENDSATFFLERGLRSLDKIKKENLHADSKERAIYDDNVIHLSHLQILILLQDRKNALAFKYINDFQEKTKNETNPLYKQITYYQIGLMYTWMGNGKDAVQSYLKSLEYSSSEKTTSNILTKLHVYYGIVDSYGIQQDYDNIINWCDSMLYQLKSAESYLKNQKSQVQYFKFHIYRYYSYSYASTNEMDKAKMYLDKCETILPDITEAFVPAFYDLQAFYYWKNKEYELADKSINKAIEGLRLDLKHSRELYFFLMKANILREWGKSDEAYDLLKQLYEKNDSINKGDLKGEIAAIESLYEVQRLETELQHKNTFLKMLFAFLILIILIVILILRNNKILRNKNINLYHKNKQSTRISNENEELKLQIIALEEKTDPLLGIIRRLDSFMKETKMYLEPDITREQVAEKISTNRQSLINAIRKSKDLSFSEYIYKLRLQNIYEDIVGDSSKKISEIFEESGFNNRSHFNREFKREFGMTPSELQAIATEERSKENDQL